MDTQEMVKNLLAVIAEQSQQNKELLKRFDSLMTDRGGVGDDDSSTTVHIPHVSRLMSDLNSRLTKFVFDAESEHTFTRWYDRYRDVFIVDGESLDDKARVRLLLGQLDEGVYDRYHKQILPKVPADVSFDDTIKTLQEMFDVQTSVFTTRYNCLKLQKLETEDYMEYTGRVNEQCEKAKIHDLDSDGLKALLWIYGMKSSQDAFIRQKLLNFLDTELKEKRTVTLHTLYKECDRWLSLKRDSKLIEDQTRVVHQVKTHKQRYENTSERVSQCWNCGGKGHLSTTCRSPRFTCNQCGGEGHKHAFCELASRYGSAETKSHGGNGGSKSQKSYKQSNRVVIGKIEVPGKARSWDPLLKQLNVNGHLAEFQVDTGSDITLLNKAQWIDMGRPKLVTPDVDAETVSGTSLKLMGMFECEFVADDKVVKAKAYVTSRLSILGMSWIMKIESMVEALQMFSCSGHELDKTCVEDVIINDDDYDIEVDTVDYDTATPARVWQQVRVDVVGLLEGKPYLVAVDAVSKWPEVIPLIDVSNKGIVNALGEMVIEVGLPSVLEVDTTMEYTSSSEFSKLCEDNGITVMMSDPRQNESDGQDFNDFMYRECKKLKREGLPRKTIEQLRAEYRSNPNLMSDNRSLAVQQKDAVMADTHMRETIDILRDSNNGATIRVFRPGDQVLMKTTKGLRRTWCKAVICRKLNAAMYVVKYKDKVMLRHPNQLRLNTMQKVENLAVDTVQKLENLAGTVVVDERLDPVPDYVADEEDVLPFGARVPSLAEPPDVRVPLPCSLPCSSRVPAVKTAVTLRKTDQPRGLKKSMLYSSAELSTNFT